MKFLVIAALFALLLLLVYSKIYPYVQALKKIFGAARTMSNASQNRSDETGGTAVKGSRPLVKCVGCGTWVPAERAIGSRTGHSVYCSRECLEKQSSGGNRKVAS